MQIHLIAVGTRMPAWVQEGYAEYARRLPRHARLNLVQVAAVKRSRNADVTRILEDEGQRLLAAVPKFDIRRPKLVPIPGQPPTADDIIRGCSFSPAR